MRILKFALLAIVVIISAHLASTPVLAQSPQAQQPTAKEEMMKAKVTQILQEGEREVNGKKYPYQKVKVQILEGSEKGQEKTITYGEQVTLQQSQKVKNGEKVVVMKMSSPGLTTYQIVDKYRLNVLLYILLAFFVLVIALNRWKGVGSILGLAVSLAVIMGFIVPQILAGRDPFSIIILGSAVILLITMYLAHGFNKPTHVAMASTLLSLLCVGVLATVFVELARLTGLGSEDAYALQFAQIEPINFQGLLLGGIIIGALGVLDDITTGLSAAVTELKEVSPGLTFQELLEKGVRIGSEHTASLVNTLFLAYASVGLPILMFILINPLNQPLWVILNSEIVAEEVVRTLAGSIGLVLAVPITTVIAAWAATSKLPAVPKHVLQKPKVKKFVRKK